MARPVLTQLDFNGIPALNFALEPVSTLPSTPTLGRLVIVSSSKKIFHGDGAVWKEVGQADGLPSISIADVTGLQGALDLKAAKAALEALVAVVDGKANTGHQHEISEIISLASRLTAIDTAIAGKANLAHTHIASAIVDLTTVIDTRIAGYIAETAGNDESLDTLREIIDMIKNNASALELMIGRHDADVGNGTSTSLAINHGLNTLDVSVDVYDKATGSTILCDITRSNVNVVTLGFAVAPTANSLRVVIKA